MRFSLLRSSLCLSLISDTRMFNSHLCINISGDTESKWYKDWYPSELPSLDPSGYSSIGNENSLPISTTDLETSVPSTGTTFQAYSAKNTPLQPLVKAALVRWFYLLYLIKTPMKPFIYNWLVVYHFNFISSLILPLPNLWLKAASRFPVITLVYLS